MSKLIFLLLGFLVAGCQANESFIEPMRPDFANVSFDVVQKQLIIEPELPRHVEGLVSQWFDQKVKIDDRRSSKCIVGIFFCERGISSINCIEL